MNWFPWVSRERLADVQRQFEQSEAERRRLLDLLLESDRPVRKQEVAAVEVPRTDEAQQDNVVAFSTPFDRIEKQFSKEFKGKRIPSTFKARAR